MNAEHPPLNTPSNSQTSTQANSQANSHTQTKEPSWQRLPYAHLAIINATNLNCYALEPLNKNKQTSWETCLSQWKRMPHSDTFDMPCVCLLPPEDPKRSQALKLALDPERLKRQGLHPIHLENDSELALLKAIKHAIEIFYTDAFRPDPVVKALQEYQKNEDALPAEPEQSEPAFREEIALPLNMRYAQVDPQQVLRPENLSSRQIHCYWLDGDAPLLSLELTEQLYRQHHRVAAELSFCDIYPQGLVPVLFQAAILGRLWHLQQENTKAAGLLEIAQRDLNLFTTEPLLAEKDYRYLRLDLRAASKRQLLSLQNLYQHLAEPEGSSGARTSGARTSTAQTQTLSLSKTLEWIEISNLRTLPRYFPIQISALCPQTCSYCPYPKIQQAQAVQATQTKPNFMSRDLWQHLLAEIVKFADDAVINLSPLGEAMMHPQFLDFVKDLLKYPSLQLVIETSGVHWQLEDIQTLLRWNQHDPRITWILGLDALDTELYRKLRPAVAGVAGAETQQQKAWTLAELLLSSEESLPRQVYLQAVRMDENEQDLENFYRYWAEGKRDLAKSLPNEKPESGKSETIKSSIKSEPRSKRELDNTNPAAQSATKKEQKPKLAQVIIQKYNSYAGFLPERQPVRLDPVERFPCRRLAREMVFGIEGQAFTCVQELSQNLAKEQRLGSFPASSLNELWQAGQALYQKHIERKYPSLCQNCDEYYVYNF